MAAFKDSAGREWFLTIDPWAIKLVKARTGVNLGKLLGDKMTGYIELLSDPANFVDVLWVLVEEQAGKRGITDEQFGRALAGDAGAVAIKAFEDAFRDFCPSRQRGVLTALAAKGEELAAQATEKVLAAIEALGRETTSSSDATSLPESVESIPAG